MNHCVLVRINSWESFVEPALQFHYMNICHRLLDRESKKYCFNYCLVRGDFYVWVCLPMFK